MKHGVQGFFVERQRAARRVAVLAVGVGILLLAPLIALTLPPFQRPLREMLRRSARFGYEGPDQYVRRITLQQIQGSNLVVHELGSVDTRRARPGGAVLARRLEDPRAQPETRRNTIGPGQADEDMTTRAVSRLANVPVVQSEDLVIEHATKPIYPQSESDRGIEGKVMVQALIDTTGRVIDVQLLASTGVRAFEHSSAEAVWQYRFRPYRPGGVPSEVYAIFRFKFLL
jgi:TonB family protein